MKVRVWRPMNPSEFWDLDEVKAAQRVQMMHPWGSDEHLAAFVRIRFLLMKEGGMTEAEAHEIMGEY